MAPLGRSLTIAVDNDEYLYHLTRYIHLNPVKAGMVAHHFLSVNQLYLSKKDDATASGETSRRSSVETMGLLLKKISR